MSLKRNAIGIDLGTTYSCVGIFENNNVHIIANEQGNKTTPSYVSFDEEERIIGEGAKNKVSRNPKNTIFDVKRLIGRKFADETIQNDMKHLSYKIVSVNDKPHVSVMWKGEQRTFSPEEISSMILSKIKSIAEDYTGTKVDDAVITVPAYFNDAQRQATKDAGTIAGLNVIRIINEPTAAAIAYGLEQKKSSGEQHILVYDLGGGTFDVSVLSIDDGIFEVKSTAGNTHLGGSDIDQILMEYFLKDFLRKHKGADAKRITTKMKRRLRTQCERAKKILSSSNSADIELDGFYEGCDYTAKISRARFENLCDTLFKSTLKSVDKALRDAQLSKSQIDEVVLVGGTTRIPKVQQLLSNHFNGKKLCKSVNPDEAVAYGAAVQAAVLAGTAKGEAKDILLIDVTPLSLGIETNGKTMTNIIDRNTTIPVTKSNTFSTFRNNQDTVTIRVFEGERPFTKDNNLLDQFNFSGILPAPRGVPQIEVTFNLDSNGILEVSAKDKKTNKEQKITIDNESGRLSKEQIQKMMDDAKKYKEQDDKMKKKVDKINAFDSMLYQFLNSLSSKETKTAIQNNQQLMDEKNKIEKKLIEHQEWLQNNQNNVKVEEIEQKTKEVNALVHPFIQKIYNKENKTTRNEDLENLD